MTEQQINEANPLLPAEQNDQEVPPMQPMQPAVPMAQYPNATYQQYPQQYYQPQQNVQYQPMYQQQPQKYELQNKNDDTDMIISIVFFVIGCFCCCSWIVPMVKYLKSENTITRIFAIFSAILFILSAAVIVFYVVIFIFVMIFVPVEDQTTN